MPALRRQSVKRGMTVMQAINATANTPLFGAVFLLPEVAWVVVAAGAVADQEDPGAGLSLVGALAYLGGVIVLTFVYHVPRTTGSTRRARPPRGPRISGGPTCRSGR